MEKTEIKQIITENLELAKQGIFKERQILGKALELMPAKHILSIVGVRRCGKSTLMKLLIRAALKNTSPDNIMYLNLEHPYFNQFKQDVNNLQLIYDIFKQDIVPGNLVYIFLDEIQFFNDWQVFVKSLYEKDEAKIVITGSNSRLFSTDLATLLSGRTLPLQMFPFSFLEAGIPLDDYITDGGFPEIVMEGVSKKLLAEMYYKNILYQDVIPRFGIQNSLAMENLSYYMLSQMGKEISYNSLRSVAHLDDKTAKQYIAYLQDANLLYIISNYDYSLKKLIGNKKKVYLVDPVFSQISFKISPDMGRLFENFVFMTLKRLGNDIYFFRNGGECDFLIKDGMHIIFAIQSCYVLNDENRKREIDGLLNAMQKFGLKDGYIVTYNQQEQITRDQKNIFTINARQFIDKFGFHSEF